MARVPIVATQAGGNAEIIADGSTGLLVPVDAPRELGAAVTDLLQHSTRAAQLALAARERAVTDDFPVDEYRRRRLLGFYADEAHSRQRVSAQIATEAGFSTSAMFADDMTRHS